VHLHNIVPYRVRPHLLFGYATVWNTIFLLVTVPLSLFLQCDAVSFTLRPSSYVDIVVTCGYTLFMEVAVRTAKAKLAELIAAAERGERVVITRHGTPTVELVKVAPRKGFDFERLAAKRKELGWPEKGEPWPAEFDDPAFSRRVLGLED
jgi:prevent-host-death family protein